VECTQTHNNGTVSLTFTFLNSVPIISSPMQLSTDKTHWMQYFSDHSITINPTF